MSAAPADRPSSEAVERVRRRLRVAPRWLAVVALVALVGLTWGLWYFAHRQFLATWTINAAGGHVDWELGDGHWKRGGISHVRFGTNWNMRDVNDRDLAAVPRLAHVRSLTLHRCRGVTDQGLASVLSRLPELRELDVANSPLYSGEEAPWPLTDAMLTSVSSLNDLEQLTLRDLRITDEGLARLAKLPKLKQLDLSGTQVTDESIPLLEAGFPTLEHVVLERTKVSDEGARRLMRARSTVAIEHPATLPDVTP
jgi:hypothetical protein